MIYKQITLRSPAHPLDKSWSVTAIAAKDYDPVNAPDDIACGAIFTGPEAEAWAQKFYDQLAAEESVTRAIHTQAPDPNRIRHY